MIINFDRIGQGGGGSGSGSTVSVQQILSAGTEIARIAVNGQNTSLYAPEGGEGGDYQVVSELPASAEEGQLFYIPERTLTEQWSGVSITASTVQGNYVAWLRRVSDDAEMFPIYKSGSDFYWEWNNDGQVHLKTDTTPKFMYQCDTTNGVFTLWYPDFDDYYVSLNGEEAGVSSAYTETTQTYTETIPAATYRYLNGQFVELKNAYYYLSKMTNEERAALYAELDAYRDNSADFPAGDYKFYGFDGDDGFFGFYELQLARFDGSPAIDFSANFQSRASGKIFQRGWRLRPDGSFENIFSSHMEGNIAATINIWNRSLSSPQGIINIYGAVGDNNDTKCIKVQLLLHGAGESILPKEAYVRRTGSWSGVLVAKFAYNGWILDTEWDMVENGATNTKWEYTPDIPDYVIGSGATAAEYNRITYFGNKLEVPADFITNITAETILMIGGVYPYGPTDYPFKLTCDGTDFNLYSGEQYNPSGSYTFLASGAVQDAASGFEIRTDYVGLSCNVSLSGGTYTFAFTGDWGQCSPYFIEIANYPAVRTGQQWYDTANSKLKVYNGTSWDVLN